MSFQKYKENRLSELKIFINTKDLSLSLQSTRLNMHEITWHYIVKPLPKTLGNFSQSLPVISPIHQWDKSPRFWHLRCYNQSKRFFHLWHKWFQQQPQLTLADVHNRTRGWTHHGLFWHLTDSVYHILWLVWSNRGGLASFSPHVLSCPHIATYPCNLWNRAGHGWNRVGYVKTIRYIQQDYKISTSLHYSNCPYSLQPFYCITWHSIYAGGSPWFPEGTFGLISDSSLFLPICFCWCILCFFIYL